MTLSQAISMADLMRPNAFGNELKTAWINEIEAHIQTEIMLINQCDLIRYDHNYDMNTVLLADDAHSMIYCYYLTAMIDYANREYQTYQNSMSICNSALDRFKGWYARLFAPANGTAEWDGYYLSAYSIAVKHGFVGTEAQWLQSLRTLLPLGMYADMASLESAVDSPETGDSYIVGTADDNRCYFWDGLAWRDIGPLRGAAGPSSVGSTTSCGIEGLLKGDGGVLVPAMAGEDYLSPSGGSLKGPLKAAPGTDHTVPRLRNISFSTVAVTPEEGELVFVY